jgi:hypothetical protein
VSNLKNCPHCNANLQGGEIPQDIAHHYSVTHWSRVIGLEYPEKYDGIWEWKCPDCLKTCPSVVQLLYLNETKAKKT